MRKIFIILVCALIPLWCFAESKKVQTDSSDKDTIRVAVHSYVHHISDINIKDQEYKIEIWLHLVSDRRLNDSLPDEIQVKDAKNVEAIL